MTTTQNFYIQLRALYERAGCPSFSAIGRESGLSLPTVTGVLAGSVRPRRETAIHIVSALCGGDSAAFRRAIKQYDMETRRRAEW